VGDKGDEAVRYLLADSLRVSKLRIHLRFFLCHLSPASRSLLASALLENTSLNGFTCIATRDYTNDAAALNDAVVQTKAPLMTWNNALLTQAIITAREKNMKELIELARNELPGQMLQKLWKQLGQTDTAEVQSLIPQANTCSSTMPVTPAASVATSKKPKVSPEDEGHHTVAVRASSRNSKAVEDLLVKQLSELNGAKEFTVEDIEPLMEKLEDFYQNKQEEINRVTQQALGNPSLVCKLECGIDSSEHYNHDVRVGQVKHGTVATEHEAQD